jgi:hypothetical protein
VILPTTFYSSPWGIRSLTPHELCAVFGFAVRLRLGGLPLSAFTASVPTQILHSLLIPVLLQVPSVAPWLPSSLITTHASSLPFATRSWLPKIARWLPHSWINEAFVTSC